VGQRGWRRMPPLAWRMPAVRSPAARRPIGKCRSSTARESRWAGVRPRCGRWGLLRKSDWGAKWIGDSKDLVNGEIEAKAKLTIHSGYRTAPAKSPDVEKWVAVDSAGRRGSTGCGCSRHRLITGTPTPQPVLPGALQDRGAPTSPIFPMPRRCATAPGPTCRNRARARRRSTSLSR